MSTFAEWLRQLFQSVRFWFVVQPWERGVRTRGGRDAHVVQPGFHWRIPYLDHVVIANTRLRVAATPSVTTSTLDGKIITASVLVTFRIVDPLRAMLALQSPEHTSAALAQGGLARAITMTPIGAGCRAALRAGLSQRIVSGRRHRIRHGRSDGIRVGTDLSALAGFVKRRASVDWFGSYTAVA